MPRLGLKLGASVLGGGASLDFSALTALPTDQQAAVQSTAETAAANLGVTAQSIVDALAAGRGVCLLGVGEGGCRKGDGSVAAQGDPVAEVRSVTGVALATQTNASLQPVSGADGLGADGSIQMDLVGLSAGNLEQIYVIDTISSSGLVQIGTGIGNWHPFSNNSFYDDCGTDNRSAPSTASTAHFDKGIYSATQTGGSYTMRWNNADISSGSGTQSLAASPTLLRSTVSSLYNGTLSACVIQNTLYTPSQRAAVHEFLRLWTGAY